MVQNHAWVYGKCVSEISDLIQTQTTPARADTRYSSATEISV
jgi:hypothetical protein